MVESNALNEGDVLLELEDIHMSFGKVNALAGISLKVRKGEIHSIIGPNGAGKTVMMNCINGLYRPQKGNVIYKGQRINNIRPHARAKLGMSRTFQKVEVFGGMTVLDHLLVADRARFSRGALFSDLFRSSKPTAAELDLVRADGHAPRRREGCHAPAVLSRASTTH